jgi:hypothetical protein
VAGITDTSTLSGLFLKKKKIFYLRSFHFSLASYLLFLLLVVWAFGGREEHVDLLPRANGLT